jgi:hypothetical protein
MLDGTKNLVIVSCMFFGLNLITTLHCSLFLRFYAFIEFLRHILIFLKKIGGQPNTLKV